DILVEFAPQHTPGFLTLTALENELARVFKRRVDLRTPQEISRYFRSEVLSGAATQYVAEV
ncbi:MAG TPA: nucleotidyltransferase, partial [Candidatus Ozemobacteraceae bacterium]|nr:nucleotidyltransferase [Candidatus Ozemobacteraceae bacterium]